MKIIPAVSLLLTLMRRTYHCYVRSPWGEVGMCCVNIITGTYSGREFDHFIKPHNEDINLTGYYSPQPGAVKGQIPRNNDRHIMYSTMQPVLY